MHSTEWIGRKSLEILGEWGASGNLLVTSFIKPHHPFDAVQGDAERYDPATLSLLPGWTEQCYEHDLALNPGYFPSKDLTEARLRRVMAYYYATIEQIDREVGAMIDVLKKKGMYDDTLIVYVSDHGEYMGQHHMLLKANYMYDSLARVPLIVKHPRGHRAGETMSGLVSLIDLAPTIVRAAGCEPGANMDGLDLARDTTGREIVFAESGRGDQVMARTKTHKLMLSTKPKCEQLYDLVRDPEELKNVYADPQHAGVVRALYEKLTEWQGTDPVPEPHLDLNAPQIAQANVPPRDLSQRKSVSEYYAKEAKAYLPGM